MSDLATHPPRLNAQHAAVLVVDLQERLVPAMHQPEALLYRAGAVVQAAGLLGVQTLVTEQYPKGLGPTVPALAEQLGSFTPHEKTKFTSAIQPVLDRLDELDTKQVVVVGIEAHVCVLATCLDLIEAGYGVFPVWDAISSRRLEDKQAARDRLTLAGAVPMTAESVLFECLGDARHEQFRAVQALIRDNPSF